MAQVGKSIGCSSRGYGFNSQQPHGSSQPSVIPFPKDPRPPFRSPQAPGTQVVHTHIHGQTLIHTKIK